MSAKLVHGCQLKVDYTPGSAVVGGDVINFGGGIAVIASVDGDANKLMGVAWPNADAVYDVTKQTGAGVVFVAGQEVWYDYANERAVENPVAGASFFGTAVAAAATGDSLVRALHHRHPGGPINGAQQSLTDAGAASVLVYRTNWTTTGAAAGTLADGLFEGQLKKIQLIVDAGDLTLTPANFGDGTTITFADAGDFAVLRFTGGEWWVVELGNDADGATAPVVA